MPSTLVHGFLPLTCALATLNTVCSPMSFRRKLAFFSMCFVLSNLPDLDLLPTLIDPSLWGVSHRYWGHNLIALSLWAALGSWIFHRAGFLKTRPACFAAVALVGSHALLDAMSMPAPPLPRTGVPLFWPWSSYEFMFPWVLFRGISLHGGHHPLYQHLVSRQFWGSLFFEEIFYSMVIFTLWLAGLRFYRLIQSRREPAAHYAERAALSLLRRRWRIKTKSLRSRANSKAASNSSGS